MNVAAISKAKSRLRLASKAIADLSLATNKDEFSDAWFSFLIAFKSVYTALEQGAKSSPQSLQWMGAKKAERRGDELLQYVYQARNDDEHGLQGVLQYNPGGLAIGVVKPGYSNAIRVNSLPGGKLHVTSLDGRPVLVEETLPHMALATVTGRGNVKYHPPTTHLGSKISSVLPIPVAELALAYARNLVQEAEGLHKPSP